MTRIGTYGANQLYISRVLDVQQRIQKSQTQVATEKKSSVYSGISADANRLINFENEKSLANQFIQNNQVAETKLQAVSSGLEGAHEVIRNFKSILDSLAQHGLNDRDRILETQKIAFNSMQELSGYLNINVGGQYLFSGGRITTPPVNLPAGSLTDFQAMFDGVQNTYPTTRTSHLRKIDISATEIGTATFDATYGLIKPSNFDAFDDLTVGSVFNVTGSTSNNDTFTHKGLVTTNASGVPLTDTTDAGPAFITSADGVTLTDASSLLSFALQPDGSIRMSGSPVVLAVGDAFTVTNSTGNAHDGTFVVTAVNGDGSVTLANDSGLYAGETTTTGAIELRKDTGADSIPDGAAIDINAALGGLDGTEAATFSVSGNTVTLTFTGASNMDTEFPPPPADTYINIQNTTLYNGTFKVTASDADSVSFEVSPTAMRVSQFVMPQTGRTDVSVSWNDGANTLTAADYGAVDFGMTADGETITSTPAGGFLDSNGVAVPAAGTVITLSSTSGVNDGQYTVKSNDGTNIVIETKTLTAESSTTASLSQESWYRGDTMTIQHRVDVDRAIDFGVFASDPALEKALRAMAIIAQGAVGTAGSLEYNEERLAAARFLLTDALDGPAAGTPPYGDEETGDIEGLQSQTATVTRTIRNTNDKHTAFTAFLDRRIIDIENVDMTEAITRLLDDQRALEAGYQALAKVRELSLMQFLT